MSPTSYHCSTPRPPMVVAAPSSVKPGSGSLPQNRAQNQERDDGHDLHTEHDAIRIHRGLPAHLAVLAHDVRTPSRSIGSAKTVRAVIASFAPRSSSSTFIGLVPHVGCANICLGVDSRGTGVSETDWLKLRPTGRNAKEGASCMSAVPIPRKFGQ